MKKIKSAVLCLAVISLLGGCNTSGVQQSEDGQGVSPTSAESIAAVESTPSDTPEVRSSPEPDGLLKVEESSQINTEEEGLMDTVDMQTLETLVDGNIRCVFDIFFLDFLPYETHEDMGEEEEIWVAVKSEEFATFEALEQYVQSIYCKEEADRLLHGENGSAVYADVDGVFSTNIKMHGGMGYYVIWDDFTIEIVDENGQECNFDVLVKRESPDGQSISDDRISMKAIFEDGEWKLEKMVY